VGFELRATSKQPVPSVIALGFRLSIQGRTRGTRFLCFRYAQRRNDKMRERASPLCN
jgi:hypothetical protein